MEPTVLEVDASHPLVDVDRNGIPTADYDIRCEQLGGLSAVDLTSGAVLWSQEIPGGRGPRFWGVQPPEGTDTATQPEWP